MRQRLLLIAVILGLAAAVLFAANSASLNSSVERRNKEPNVGKVWERVTLFLIEPGGGHAEISEEIIVNGILKEMIIEVGAASGITGTVNVDFDDNRGVEFDTNATLGEGSETIVSMATGTGKPVVNFTIRLDASDDPVTNADDWQIFVTCRGD